MKGVIVFGGSAGGVESLCAVLASLPHDLAASLLAVIRTGETGGAQSRHVKLDGNLQFRSHVGHKFLLQSFTEAQSDALERALWMVLRQLNEQRFVQNNLARSSGNDRSMQKRFQ